MAWYLCNMGHKQRTQDAATNCGYCKANHRRWIERLGKEKLDWAKQKARIAKKKTMTKMEFLKLSHPKRWEVVSLLVNVNWYCQHCDTLVDDGKRPRRIQPFAGAVRYCGNCDGVLTHRTGGGMSDSCGYYPMKIK